MTNLVAALLAVSAVLCLSVTAQVVGPRALTNPRLRSQQQQPDYRTCIGQTAAGDEMKVTFSTHRSTPSNWWQSGSSTNNIEVKAIINSRSLTNKFRLVTTEHGRIDGMCESESLGNIIDERMYRRGNIVRPGGQKSQNIGYIGTTFALSPGKSVRITDHIQTMLNLDILAGGGMALCPVQQIVGVRCIDLISLCCAISRDTRPADVMVKPFNSNSLQGGNQFSNAQSGLAVNPVTGNGMLSNGAFNNVQSANGALVNPAFNGGQNNMITSNNNGRIVGNNLRSNTGNMVSANGMQMAPMQNINSVQINQVQG